MSVLPIWLPLKKLPVGWSDNGILASGLSNYLTLECRDSKSLPTTAVQLAKAVMDIRPEEWHSKYRLFYACQFCGSTGDTMESLVHNPVCIVCLAEDVLRMLESDAAIAEEKKWIVLCDVSTLRRKVEAD